MKIRYTSPIVFTNDASNIIAQMEAVGFHKTHVKDEIADTGVISTSMKNDMDQPLVVVQAPGFPATFSGIRLNVENFAEALEEFTKMGYTNLQAGSTDTGSSYATLLRSPEGVFVSLAEHLK